MRYFKVIPKHEPASLLPIFMQRFLFYEINLQEDIKQYALVLGQMNASIHVDVLSRTLHPYCRAINCEILEHEATRKEATSNWKGKGGSLKNM